jgi:hypothetical protein
MRESMNPRTWYQKAVLLKNKSKEKNMEAEDINCWLKMLNNSDKVFHLIVTVGSNCQVIITESNQKRPVTMAYAGFKNKSLLASLQQISLSQTRLALFFLWMRDIDSVIKPILLEESLIKYHPRLIRPRTLWVRPHQTNFFLSVLRLQSKPSLSS